MASIKAFQILLPCLIAIAPASAKLANQTSSPHLIGANPVVAQKVQAPQPTQRLQQRVLRVAAKQFRIPFSQLKIQAAQSREWNGCLGVVKTPQTVCTASAIPGWQMVVTTQAGDRDWVYHSDSRGQRIVYNFTASRPEINPFTPRAVTQLIATKDLPPFEPKVVFRVTVASYSTGNQISTVLAKDGVITRFYSGPTIRKSPEVLKRLTPREVQQFQDLLLAQNISNLNGIHYPAISKTSSGESVTYQSAVGGVVSIGAPEISPDALNRISAAWSVLAPTTMHP